MFPIMHIVNNKVQVFNETFGWLHNFYEIASYFEQYQLKFFSELEVQDTKKQEN